MGHTAVAMVALILMVGTGRAWAIGPHEALSQRPEIRALQEKMLVLEERRDRFRKTFIAAEYGEPDARARRDAARTRLGLAEEAWALAEEARKLWRPAFLVCDLERMAVDEEAVEIYLEAFSFATSQESSALSTASDLDFSFVCEWTATHRRGPTLEERLGKLTRKLVEIQSELGAEDVRPAPGLLHRPPEEEARWLAYSANKLAQAARMQAVNQWPMESFELYVQCVGLSLLADAYFLNVWPAPR